MFEWTPEKIRWLENASEYGDYYRTVAGTITPFLSPADHVCDAGCGLGYLAAELAGTVRRVTAVDREPAVIRRLEAMCRRRGISNIAAHTGELSALEPAQPYDAMVFCLAGSLREDLAAARRMCRGQVFVLKRAEPAHRFSAAHGPLTGMEPPADAAALLERLGIPFQHQMLEVEFGQPFRDLEDARAFFRAYDPDGAGSGAGLCMEAQLIATGDGEYPLYLPRKRTLWWAAFLSSDIPPAAEIM